VSDPGVTAPPPVTSTTLGDLFEEIGTREPDALAYVDGEQRLTYGEWLAGADSLAAELRARGVAPGDVVAFWLSSCIDYAVAYAACTRLGAVATGINTRLGPGEVTAILQRCEPVALLHEGDAFAIPGDAPTPKVLMPRAEVAQAWTAGTELTDRPRRDPGDPVCIVWTSGTTGLPKGAWFDHRAMEASARLSNILSSYHDVRLMPVPFPHAGYMNKLWDQVEFVINSVLTGTPWTVESMLDNMVRERVTVGQGVPTQWSKLVDLPQLADADLSSLRLASTGSAPVTPELAEKMRTRLGCPIVVRYACTESSSITGTRVDDPPEVLLHTVGRPQEGIELVLRDDDGAAVPDGEVGVVTLRSPCSMRGYWNDPERTADTLSPDGWITTSDLGRLRDDGNLVLCGRTSEMYIRGGFNIHPLEVERVVADHPKVARVAIVGTPAPTIGEIGVAFVEPVDAADPPTLDELRAFVRARLADYKQPDRLEVVAELPLTSMLKIDKRVLQAQLTAEG
jgi:acyl-CoA synthetase (AMP-forming)/AMP-acid ligase II